MKREELKALGLSDEQIDKIMQLNGQDIEKHKTTATTLQTQLEGLQTQLTEANTTIEGFKKLDVESIQKAADEWKTKAEQAAADAQQQVAQLKFEHALDQALTGAKAKNAKAVRALLQMDALKLNEADGSIVGLKEQLEKLQGEADYLFESDQPAPRVVAGGNHTSVSMDAFETAMRKGAGLSVEK